MENSKGIASKTGLAVQKWNPLSHKNYCVAEKLRPASTNILTGYGTVAERPRHSLGRRRLASNLKESQQVALVPPLLRAEKIENRGSKSFLLPVVEKKKQRRVYGSHKAFSARVRYECDHRGEILCINHWNVDVDQN